MMQGFQAHSNESTEQTDLTETKPTVVIGFLIGLDLGELRIVLISHYAALRIDLHYAAQRIGIQETEGRA